QTEAPGTLQPPLQTRPPECGRSGRLRRSVAVQPRFCTQLCSRSSQTSPPPRSPTRRSIAVYCQTLRQPPTPASTPMSENISKLVSQAVRTHLPCPHKVLPESSPKTSPKLTQNVYTRNCSETLKVDQENQAPSCTHDASTDCAKSDKGKLTSPT
uniref:CJ090 protein n=1 Tax=Mesocestoides corti TaxID=53468 RepID=A0A5K3FCY6_MESCO